MTLMLIEETKCYRISKDQTDNTFMIVYKCYTDGHVAKTLKEAFRFAFIHNDQCLRNR